MKVLRWSAFVALAIAPVAMGGATGFDDIVDPGEEPLEPAALQADGEFTAILIDPDNPLFNVTAADEEESDEQDTYPGSQELTTIPEEIDSVEGIESEEIQLNASTDQSVSGYVIDRRFIDWSRPTTWIPPDPIGAAGLSSVISVVNSAITARTRFGVFLFRANLNSFFSTFAGKVFDPKVIYDSFSNRFVVVALNTNRGETKIFSNILVAASRSGNPQSATRRDWFTYRINSLVANNWADYPGIAVDEEAVYITNNMFTRFPPGFFRESRMWFWGKAQMYRGQTISVRTFRVPNFSVPSRREFTYMPAELRTRAGSRIGTYLISSGGRRGIYNTNGDTLVHVVRLIDPLSSTVFAVDQYVNIGAIETTPDRTRDIPDAPQRGTSFRIETNDRRMLKAYWDNGNLWGAFTILRNGQTAAYWVKLFTGFSTTFFISFRGRGPIYGEDIAPRTFTYYPSIAVNRRRVVALGFSASASTEYAGAFLTIRDDVNDPPGEVRQSGVVASGQASYYNIGSGTRNRWGDYTGMVNDPLNDNCFWAYNQFAGKTRNTWNTAWARVCVTTEEGKKSKAPKAMKKSREDVVGSYSKGKKGSKIRGSVATKKPHETDDRGQKQHKR